VRAFVTGATGFLGERLVRELLMRGAEVRCLARSVNTFCALPEIEADGFGRLEWVRGSLEQVGAYDEALSGCDAVFHLAAVMRGAPAVLFQNNVVATRRLIEAAARFGVRRLVLVSSLAVYGTAQLRAGDVLDERCPLEPFPHWRDGYSFSKIAQEEVAWEAHRNGQVPLVVIRPGVLYGPGRDCLTNRLGLRLGKYLVLMGGFQPLPYSFVDNCSQALYLAGTTPGIEGEAFNIVDDGLPVARELLARYRTGVEQIRVLPIPESMIGVLSHLCAWYHRISRGQLPPVLTPYKSAAQWKPLRYANAKAKELLGWQPQTDFVEGLRQTFGWLRNRRLALEHAPA
jgi:nucleoside-diphosphate-sugar epimerase